MPQGNSPTQALLTEARPWLSARFFGRAARRRGIGLRSHLASVDPAVIATVVFVDATARTVLVTGSCAESRMSTAPWDANFAVEHRRAVRFAAPIGRSG